MSLLRQSLLALAAVLSSAAGENQGTPDIFANFHIRESVTGNEYYFRVLLDRPCAPTAVANFLGLVTGARAWIDSSTGHPTTRPFYEGTQIYEVVRASEIIPGAPTTATGEIHFGSPTNDRTGGPGYIFQDISLVPPGSGNDGLWQVYMENDGPNTNGSRFFISGVSQNINDQYTRLGVVQQDSGAPYPLNSSYINLNRIGNAARDEDDKPFYDLTIESITIDGWDENDPTFLIDTWNLPSVDSATFLITKQGGFWKLFGFAPPGAVLTYQKSTDLVNWGQFLTHVDLPGSGSFGIDLSVDIQFSPRTFYRGSSVLYPTWPASDFDPADAILIFDYTDKLHEPNQRVKLRIDFSSSGKVGIWKRWVNGGLTGSGEFSADYTIEEPYLGTMIVTPLTGMTLSPFTFRLHFEHHFPTDAVVNRFEAFTLPPNEPESHAGTWKQLPN